MDLYLYPGGMLTASHSGLTAPVGSSLYFVSCGKGVSVNPVFVDTDSLYEKGKNDVEMSIPLHPMDSVHNTW